MRMLGAIGRRYKFFWQGCNKGTVGGVDVVRVNERIMYVKLVIGKQIIHIVSTYAPQVGLGAEENDDFLDSFIIVLSGIPKQGIISSDMNGHVGRDADGYGAVHGGVELLLFATTRSVVKSVKVPVVEVATRTN